MTDEEFAAILASGHETAGVEFKGPGHLSDGRLMAQVVKAVLGMANRRDGGRVIIGVRDDGEPVGLSDEELSTWVYDHVADQIAVYADPSVTFELEVKEYNGSSYVVLQVEEFSDIPVLCKRAYADILRDGACYVRTRRKPETSEIPTQTEMRDLLTLAIDKGVKEYITRAERLGLTRVRVDIPLTDQEHFDEELGELK